MNEQQIHELIGRLTIQIEVLRLALIEAQAKLAAQPVEAPSATAP